MKILVFTEGTILIHGSGIVPNKGKVDWEKHSKRDPSISNYSSYRSIKNAVRKIKTWKNKGAKICYLTPGVLKKEINEIKIVLKKFDFPEGELFFRKPFQKKITNDVLEYIEIVKKIKPDIWIDDDCESLGGRNNKEDVKIRNLGIKLIIVKEFGGIDHLSDSPEKLLGE